MTDKQAIIFKGEFTGEVDKVNKIAYGWAYVAKKGDTQIVDHSGDIWDIKEIEKTAHDFIACRTGGESHVYKGGAVLVESLVFSEEVQKALGIDLGKIGWFVGFEILDDDLLEKVQKGELSMFSIGGTGEKEEING